MDELTPTDEWSCAFHGISKERDRLLGSASAIPPARRAALDALLAREFPVEVALRAARARRDRLLEHPPREIPRSIATSLRSSLTNKGWSWWTNFLMRPALVAASLIVGFGIITLGRWGRIQPSPRHETLAPQPVELASRNQLSLRMSATELASLRTTFLASNRTSLPEDADAPTRLRLDLPVRALLGGDGTAGTP